MAAYDNKVLTGDALADFAGLVKSALADKQDTLVFNTAYNASSNKVATVSDLPDISGKQDTLVFNTAYDASSNKVATMSDLSGKQDTITFNTAYSASSNKAATMADLPDISGKQDTLVFNTAYNASSNKVATMSDIPDISGKQDALVFNTAYNSSSNKVATMSDITSAISGISSGFSFEVVNSLPSQDISTSKIYLVAKSTSETNQAYDEYIYVNSSWEKIGDTQISIEALSSSEINTIWAAASAS